MTTFERLKIKIKQDTGLDVTDFKRTYASINRKGSGAFVWVAELSYSSCGSTSTATDLLKKDNIKLIENPRSDALPEFI